MENDNQIVEIIKQNSLEVTQAEKMLAPLVKFLEEAKSWEKEAKKIVVTDITQVKEMSDAKKARISLKKIRTAAEDTRKELKERSLREGKAIDGVANIIKAVIVPIEEYLEKQEKFAEIREKERKEILLRERIELLQKFNADPNLYNLKEMSPESFIELLKSIKMGFDAKNAADEKLEKERIEREEAKAIEDEKMRKENIRLKKEADEKETIRLKEKSEADEKIKKAEIAKKKAEAELAEKEQKEQAEKKRFAKESEEKEKQEVETKRKAEAAPDKAKMVEFAIRIKNIQLPTVTSEESKSLVKLTQKKLLEISQELESKLLEF